MTPQQAAPASAATQKVSAFPLARKTRYKAQPAPTQTGNKAIATMVLNHFGTGPVSEFLVDRSSSGKTPTLPSLASAGAITPWPAFFLGLKFFQRVCL